MSETPIPVTDVKVTGANGNEIAACEKGAVELQGSPIQVKDVKVVSNAQMGQVANTERDKSINEVKRLVDIIETCPDLAKLKDVAKEFEKFRRYPGLFRMLKMAYRERSGQLHVSTPSFASQIEKVTSVEELEKLLNTLPAGASAQTYANWQKIAKRRLTALQTA